MAMSNLVITNWSELLRIPTLKNSLRSCLISLSLLLGLGLAACKKAAAPPAVPQALPVQTMTVASSPVPRSDEYVTTIKSRRSATLNPQVDGNLTSIFIHSGEHVKAGQVLMQIDPLKQQAAVQSQASTEQQKLAVYKYNQTEVDRQRKLFAAGVTSRDSLDQAEQAYSNSKADYESATASRVTQEQELAYYKIRAPFDGIVDDRYVDVGDYMRVGDKCEMVIAPEPFLAVGTVSEEDVGKLKVGDPASATLITGETVQGKIHFVADRADQMTRTFRLEVELPNPDAKLRDGVSADIHVPVKQLKAIRISPAILVLDDQGAVGVRAVVDGRVRFFPVKIVEDSPAGMWIAGLPDRVTVITVGQQFVNDGERVNDQVAKSGSAS